VNAAFMPSQRHERGTHAVWLGAGEAGVTEVRFGRAPMVPGRIARPFGTYRGL
jgi:hypothetical protein